MYCSILAYESSTVSLRKIGSKLTTALSNDHQSQITIFRKHHHNSSYIIFIYQPIYVSMVSLVTTAASLHISISISSIHHLSIHPSIYKFIYLSSINHLSIYNLSTHLSISSIHNQSISFTN